MLSSIFLSNVALIKKQNIDFKNGFNCILGQSGAGKSIIIDALSFSLGAKADKSLIRSNENLMRVDAVFTDISKEALNLLQDWNIDFDGELIISRTLNIDGKSSIKINGFPATTKMLKDLSSILTDFCGQHDSVGLLNENNHLLILDKFAGVEVETLKKQVEIAYDEYKTILDKISNLGGDETERERTKDLLTFQINEITNANLIIGEDETLRERYDFISSAENIYEKVSNVLNKLDEQNGCVTSFLHDSKNELSNLSNFKEIENCRERIENCYYEIKDVVDTLENVRQNTDFDANELERIDSRLDLIKSLSKKYGKSIEDILDYKSKLESQLNELENSQEILNNLQKEEIIKKEELLALCDKLSVVRKNNAVDFEKRIISELDDLQMKGTRFSVCFEKDKPTKNGYDNVKFLFSANVGQDVKDLNKTASGGELSRLLLAFKNVMLDKDHVQTIVFDEIDSGISGHTAGKLAEKLVNISKYTQIICITHTPVVASRGNEFLLVEKKVIDNNTISVVNALKGNDIVTEIAKLIDGNQNVSQTAIEHAKKLLEEKS